ncbi:hypothetical protein [Methanoculleus chikugoensis]|uniref:hypothetical protein n=1 Tax=Methanoculleus chikugoensis TaxID=118126 RepID=UPI001FB2A4AE|nr:hypothetical protein [Methanoculleus chikugoensis]
MVDYYIHTWSMVPGEDEQIQPISIVSAEGVSGVAGARACRIPEAARYCGHTVTASRKSSEHAGRALLDRRPFGLLREIVAAERDAMVHPV